MLPKEFQIKFAQENIRLRLKAFIISLELIFFCIIVKRKEESLILKENMT